MRLSVFCNQNVKDRPLCYIDYLLWAFTCQMWQAASKFDQAPPNQLWLPSCYIGRWCECVPLTEVLRYWTTFLGIYWWYVICYSAVDCGSCFPNMHMFVHLLQTILLTTFADLQVMLSLKMYFLVDSNSPPSFIDISGSSLHIHMLHFFLLKLLTMLDMDMYILNVFISSKCCNGGFRKYFL